MKEVRIGQIWVTKQNHKALHRDITKTTQQKRTTWAIDWVDDFILCVDDINKLLTIITDSPSFFVSVSHPYPAEGLLQSVVASDILEFCDYVGEL